MRFKFFITSMVLLAYALIVSSQVREISVISDAKKKGTNQSTRLVLTIPSSKRLSDNKVEEYVLYRDIIRKYSWYEGVGTPISQETANHLPFYYKLSMKNNHGHWQHIEAMHQNDPCQTYDTSICRLLHAEHEYSNPRSLNVSTGIHPSLASKTLQHVH